MNLKPLMQLNLDWSTYTIPIGHQEHDPHYVLVLKKDNARRLYNSYFHSTRNHFKKMKTNRNKIETFIN